MKGHLLLLLICGLGLGVLVMRLARWISVRKIDRAVASLALDSARFRVEEEAACGGIGPKNLLRGAAPMLPKPWQATLGSPDYVTAWHLRTLSSCENANEARIRLTAALHILGGEAEPEPESGLSERQQTLEQLIRSVVIFLAR